MKPLNAKDRTQALLLFLALLIVSITLVVCAIFFDFSMPTKENAVLKKQYQEMQEMMSNQNRMLGLMDSIESNLAVLDKPDANATYTEGVVTNLLIEMNNSLKDSSSSGIVYKKIAANYRQMLDDKARIRNLRKDTEEGGDCAKELEQCKRDILEYQKMLTNAGVGLPK